eukprot:GHVN01073672.1.p1 GENE.GHVN01073672.1~~GHVN01073672.1.p1  ORF type:complete len:181 (+),score=21.86 GHVN01073672.1:270-812(+)
MCLDGFLTQLKESEGDDKLDMVPQTLSIAAKCCRAKETICRTRALTWVHDLLALCLETPKFTLPSSLYHKILQCALDCADDQQETIRQYALSTSDILVEAVGNPAVSVDTKSLVEVLADGLNKSGAPVRICALQWISMFLEKRWVTECVVAFDSPTDQSERTLIVWRHLAEGSCLCFEGP